jgi:diguanylate cyclase (GGDEF)-like protein
MSSPGNTGVSGGKRRRKDRDAASSSPMRVLAVDDDRAYLSYLALVLRRAGFEVEVANDGPTAIARLHEEPAIDLMLVDLAMPLMDGIEVVRRIRADQQVSGLYTILLTAHDGTDVKLRALDNGLDDFLTKLSSASEIIAKLRSASRRRAMELRLHIENAALHTLALTDELTGIGNRRALFREAEQFLAAKRQLSVVLFDLDRFKQINDSHGHLTGDRILAGVAASFKGNTRVNDIIARYGGDEFVLLLPDTGTDEARLIARRLCDSVAKLRWTVDRAIFGVTASFGAAAANPNLDTALRHCDEQLHARKLGRIDRDGAPAESQFRG